MAHSVAADKGGVYDGPDAKAHGSEGAWKASAADQKVGTDLAGAAGGAGGANGAAPLPFGAAPDDALDAAAHRAMHKTTRHVVVLFALIALINHLDRSNLAYAALTLNRDNKFTPQIYSLGAALFFVTFCVFQVPSNMVMARVGFRPWLAFLLVAWGAIAVCFMFISSPWTFYFLRLLLGVFEAGAFPAMWWALSTFFPRSRLTKPYAYLTIGIMAANMIGAPLAAGLLAMDGVGGLKGWQWLFLLEGIPAVLLGVIVYALLPSSIQTARFLTQEERDALAAAVARDVAPGDELRTDLRGQLRLLRLVLANRYLWVIFFSGVMMSIAGATYTTYTPIIISNLLAGTALSNSATVSAAQGSKSLTPVALTMIPYTLAVVLSYVVAHSSQRRNELFFHITSCLVFAGVLMSLFSVLAAASIYAGFVALTLSLASCFASNGPGMVLVARLCKGREQLLAQPTSNIFNMTGGVVGPLVTAALINSLGGFKYLSLIMGIMMVATALTLLLLRLWVNRDGGLPDGGVGERYRSSTASASAAPSATHGHNNTNGLEQVVVADSKQQRA